MVLNATFNNIYKTDEMLKQKFGLGQLYFGLTLHYNFFNWTNYRVGILKTKFKNLIAVCIEKKMESMTLDMIYELLLQIECGNCDYIAVFHQVILPIIYEVRHNYL